MEIPATFDNIEISARLTGGGLKLCPSPITTKWAAGDSICFLASALLFREQVSGNLPTSDHEGKISDLRAGKQKDK